MRQHSTNPKIEEQELNIQLSWVYVREFGEKREEREADYKRTLKAILERSEIPKSEFLLLTWMSEHVGQENETAQVAEEIGMSEGEVDKCLEWLVSKSLVSYDEYFRLEVARNRVENYYLLMAQEESLKRAEEEKVEEYTVTEQDILSDLKKMAKEYVRDDRFSYDPSRFEKFAEKNPDAQFSKGYMELFSTLNHDEQKALLILAGYVVWKGFVPLDYPDNSGEYEDFDSLIQKGIALVYPQEVGKDDGRPDNRIIISHKACRALFYGHRELVRYSSLSQQTEVIKHEEISEKELYYEPKDKNIVGTLSKIVSEEKYQEVTRRLKQKGLNSGISVILHGGPGVGKTELIKQLARRSKRDIFNIDASKVYGSLWGETEKNVRAVFRNFKYMASICPTAPILLFNEADNILKKRGVGIGGSISRSEDIIQTIILQEMENFEGFFFATTNLVDNLDKAFERRFLFKLEVHSPGLETRTKILGSLIPELDVKQRKYLAEHFAFSGGQIENISRRKDIFEALEGRTPTTAEIEKFCNEEQETSEIESHGKIGFVIGSGEKNEPLNTKHIKQ